MVKKIYVSTKGGAKISKGMLQSLKKQGVEVIVGEEPVISNLALDMVDDLDKKVEALQKDLRLIEKKTPKPYVLAKMGKVCVAQKRIIKGKRYGR